MGVGVEIPFGGFVGVGVGTAMCYCRVVGRACAGSLIAGACRVEAEEEVRSRGRRLGMNWNTRSQNQFLALFE